MSKEDIQYKVVAKELNQNFDMLNIEITSQDIFNKRTEWKSFKGMVYQLKLLNKRYKKLGVTGEFTVKLPLK